MYIFIIGHLLTEEERGRRFSFRYRRPFVVIGASPTSILVNTNIPYFEDSSTKNLNNPQGSFLKYSELVLTYEY